MARKNRFQSSELEELGAVLSIDTANLIRVRDLSWLGYCSWLNGGYSYDLATLDLNEVRICQRFIDEWAAFSI